jgi:hypothetical protein
VKAGAAQRQRKAIGLGGAAVLTAAALLLALGSAARGAQADNQCIACHEAERLPISLGHTFQEWRASAHARGGIGCEKCHGGDPSAADTAAAHRGVLPGTDPQSLVGPKRIVATCSGCHTTEGQAYATTVHAHEVEESGHGATCVTCHGTMATNLPTPTELSARCAVCHKKPTQVQAALAVLDTAKMRLYRLHRKLEAPGVDPAWREQERERFRELENKYRDIELKWHTFAMTEVIRISGEVIKLAKLLDEEGNLRTTPQPQQ